MSTRKDFELLSQFHELTIRYLDNSKTILEQVGPGMFDLVRLKVAPFLQVLRSCAEQTQVFVSANAPKPVIPDEVVPDNVIKLNSKGRRPLEMD